MTTHMIEISTAEGVAKAVLVKPADAIASKAGVILYMDIFGLRSTLTTMAERLANEGYTVLVPDLFYRFENKQDFDPKTAFSDPVAGPKLKAMKLETTQAMTASDSAAFIAALDEAGATGPVGVVGYCMGGAYALTAAARYAERVAAAASFHGGNLATDAPDSPHLGAQSIKARVYVGAAGVDGSFPPAQAGRLAEAMAEAEVDFMLENYKDMKHGWTISDHGVYDRDGSERHWTRLLTFLGETLKSA